MKDAWKQFQELLEKYTMRLKVRKDIEVVARATDRGVELILWSSTHEGMMTKRSYQTTGPRNVVTMRELADALNAACDFVEDSNPEWAKHNRE